MKREELLKECYRQRGYIVTYQAQEEGEPPFELGEIVTRIGGECLDLGQPFAVAAETNKQDLIDQMNLCFLLHGAEFYQTPGGPAAYIESQIVGRSVRYFRLVTD